MRRVRQAYRIAGVICLIVGLAAMIGAIRIHRYGIELMKNGVSVQGKYTQVDRGNTWIEYQAGGQRWRMRDGYDPKNHHTGDQVTIWYMPGQPDQARMIEWQDWGPLLMFGIGYTAIGAWLLAAAFKPVWLRQRLMKKGIRVEAQVRCVQRYDKMRIFGVYPYVICAECVHPRTDQRMELRSEFLTERPTDKIKNGEIGVLLDPLREDRYYMLTDGL